MDAQLLIQQWRDAYPLADKTLDLQMGYSNCRIRSNSVFLLDRLAHYFSALVTTLEDVDKEVIALETDAIAMPDVFIDWQREAGKTGRKDSYYDLEHGRLVRKVRTGMVFYQSIDECIAIGPCCENDNQVINFINSQFMNTLQQNDWLICHAAALVSDGHGLALAGFSGGGKSTLMLTMLEQAQWKFMSNDRLFIRAAQEGVNAAGIPKQPRINPGTILHNPRLRPMLTEADIQRYESLSADALWELEEKYDADIEQFYGTNKVQYQGKLHSLVILNWSRHTDAAPLVKQVSLRERPELLAAVTKSPGPFYQDNDGEFIADDYVADEQAYLTVADKLAVYEVTGGVDFQNLAKQLSALKAGVAS